MKLYHIVAMSENRVIGRNNQLPWYFAEDLKHFKQVTMGSTVIMGRKTFESIGSKPLPGRENFVLSRWRSAEEHLEHLKFFDSLDKAIKEVRTEKAFIAGGAELYRQTIEMADGIYLTYVKSQFDGDAFYPPIPACFKEISKEPVPGNPHLEFIYYENTKK